MSDNAMLIEGTAWYLVFLFSTTVHEASHALVAWKLGDDTAYRGGQVSLDPTPHIRREPFGMVVAPIISFFAGGWMIGWASAPYDVLWARQYPKRAAWMAVAGPASNFALVIVAAAAIHLGLAVGLFQHANAITPIHLIDTASTGIGHAMGMLISLFFSLNLLLFTFNLLPCPPLDGSSIVTLFLPDSMAEKFREAAHSPVFSLIGFIVAWKLFGVIYPLVQSFAITCLFPGLYR